MDVISEITQMGIEDTLSFLQINKEQTDDEVTERTDDDLLDSLATATAKETVKSSKNPTSPLRHTSRL